MSAVCSLRAGTRTRLVDVKRTAWPVRYVCFDMRVLIGDGVIDVSD